MKMKPLFNVRFSPVAVELCIIQDGKQDIYQIAPTLARIMAEELLRIAREVEASQ